MIADFIHIYSGYQHLNIDNHCKFLHQAMNIKALRQLTNIAKVKEFECWIFSLTELLLFQQPNDPDKNYALIWACQNGYTSTVELLLDRKADVGAKGNCALRLASCKGHTLIVELLLNRKADVTADDNFALRWASYYGHTSTVKLLLDRKTDVGAKGNCALVWASKNGHKSTVQLLLDRNARCAVF